MGDEAPLAAMPETDARSCPHEDVFQSLPPLGSVEFVHFVQTAAVTEIPPEVLVRVFRQVPPTSEASRVVLERLFRKRGESWDYLGPLVVSARRRSRRYPRDGYQDLLQDTAERILRILPTERAQLAERSWNAFCHRELVEAWRAKSGRRGERLPVRGASGRRKQGLTGRRDQRWRATSSVARDIGGKLDRSHRGRRPSRGS
jgi:hypothetical protein